MVAVAMSLLQIRSLAVPGWGLCLPDGNCRLEMSHLPHVPKVILTTTLVESLLCRSIGVANARLIQARANMRDEGTMLYR